jgi:hypothetical protein
MTNRRPSLFRQRDISRAIKATKSAGEQVVRIEVDRDGKIVIITAREVTQPANALDEWLTAHAD